MGDLTVAVKPDKSGRAGMDGLAYALATEERARGRMPRWRAIETRVAQIAQLAERKADEKRRKR